MNLVPFNPWREMSTLQSRINRFFDDSFLSPARFDDDLDMGSWYPTVDMYDNEDSIVIKADLPGVDSPRGARAGRLLPLFCACACRGVRRCDFVTLRM